MLSCPTNTKNVIEEIINKALRCKNELQLQYIFLEVDQAIYNEVFSFYSLLIKFVICIKFFTNLPLQVSQTQPKKRSKRSTHSLASTKKKRTLLAEGSQPPLFDKDPPPPQPPPIYCLPPFSNFVHPFPCHLQHPPPLLFLLFCFFS